MTDGSVSVKASLDDKNYVAGMDALIRKVDKAELKLKEFNVEGKRGEGILNSLGMLAGGLGGALVTAMTAGVAASPQFKAFLGELSVPFFELTEFLGNKFEPLFDRIVPLVEEFADTVINSDFVNDSLDDFIGNIQTVLDILVGISKAWKELPEPLKDTVVGGVKLGVSYPLGTGQGQELLDQAGSGTGLFGGGDIMGEIGLKASGNTDARLSRLQKLSSEVTQDIFSFNIQELKRDIKEVSHIWVSLFAQDAKRAGLY